MNKTANRGLAQPNDHGLNPQTYLTYALTRIADTKVTQIDQLLPWNVASTLAT